MAEIERREFLKLAGAGAGAAVASSLFHDQLLAGVLPPPGLGLVRGTLRRHHRSWSARSSTTALSKGGDFADLLLRVPDRRTTS